MWRPLAIDGDFLVVTGNGIPDHAYGNFPGECGNPNSVGAQNDAWRLPLDPEMTSTPAINTQAAITPAVITARYGVDGAGVDA